MGARIEAVATADGTPGGLPGMLVPALGRLRRKGALALADEAAKKCLEKAGRSAAEAELLINVGIYRDKNLGEPALASIIQEDIAEAGRVSEIGRGARIGHGTFSFDLADGGCGAVHALALLDRFIRSGTLQLGLIVASDADPGGAREFPYPAAGGAALLAPGKEGEGFAAFYFEDFPEFESLLEARVAWEPHRVALPLSAGGRNVLSIRRSPGYSARCIECAEAAIEKFLARERTALSEIDLIVASQSPPEFPDALERRLKLPGDRVVRVSEPFEGALTAAPIAGIDAAQRSGRFQRARRVLFVTVGAGISVALALYDQPGA